MDNVNKRPVPVEQQKYCHNHRRILSTTSVTISRLQRLIILVLMTLIIITIVECKKRSPRESSTSSSVFIQLPFSSPPTVKPPPYFETSAKCPAINLRENWIDTLCGDLNSGFIPMNPMEHKFPDGESYPFEIIKKRALEFFRRVLPVLKNDKSLPKVAKFNPYEVNGLVQTPEPHHFRMKKTAEISNATVERLTWLMPPGNTSAIEDNNSEAESRSSNINSGFFGLGSNPKQWRQEQQQQHSRFCQNPNPNTPGAMTYFHRFCKLYNTMWGKLPYQTILPPAVGPILNNDIRQTDNNDRSYQHRIINSQSVVSPQRRPHPRYHRYEALHTSEAKIEVPPGAAAQQNLPPTPCPSQVEYLTPVFARNHEGSWRYIVQIPREGYFTQTVEVTKCKETHCFYMDGDCKTSPRWQSLLVAELYYPDTSFPTTTSTTTTTPRPPLLPVYENSNENSEYHKYQQYLKKKRKRNGRDYWSAEKPTDNYYSSSSSAATNFIISSSSSTTTEIPPECDGMDHIGCFQVRLFYDWFLIPGSCKCWRRTFDFTRVHNRLK